MTCADVKGIYKDNECCNANLEKVTSTMAGSNNAVGVRSDCVTLGLAPNYPPYTQWNKTAGQPPRMAGFSKDFVDLMKSQCGMCIDVILGAWSDCWTAKPTQLSGFSEVSEYVGDGINEGKISGCVAYTHTKGERELSLEFTDSIFGTLKTAGILSRLDGSGNPVVSPTLTDYTGVKLGDVQGWAPTTDTFAYNTNACANNAPFINAAFADSDGTSWTEKACNAFGTQGDCPTTYCKWTMVGQSGECKFPDGNDAAVAALNAGVIDALYIYADQIAQLSDTSIDDQFGKANGFAYIHTGLDKWSMNGTVAAISKRGSGLAAVLNPCIRQVVKTQEYATTCEKYFQDGSCIQNGFNTYSSNPMFYDKVMSARTDSNDCAQGYCTCPAL